MSKDEWKKSTKNEWKKWLGVVGRMLLAYALVFAQGAWATQKQATKDKSGSKQSAAVQQAAEKQSAAATAPIAQSKQAQGEESESTAAGEKLSGDGRHESIKVHGHWTIEVKNPDGSLVRHVEFENSLSPGYSYGATTAGGISYTVQITGGAAYLAALHSGGAVTPPTWEIVLSGPAGPSNPYTTTNAPCFDNGSKFAQCRIFPSSINAASGPAYSTNLVVSSVGTAPVFTAAQLSGSVQVNQNGQISTVETRIINSCTNFTQSPCAFAGTGAGLISTGPNPTQLLAEYSVTISTNFPGAPISVSAGQTIAVTVVISFS